MAISTPTGKWWSRIAAGKTFSMVTNSIPRAISFKPAVAYHRSTKRDRLLKVACRFADYIASVFGEGKRAGTPGHPEIETALVELYRTTQEPRYLDLARFPRPADGLLGNHRLGSPAYYQDHVPVREAKTVEGHAVRQLYLTAGVTDLYLETGEAALMAAMEAQWHNMVSRKLHVTGGLGAQHAGEALANPMSCPTSAPTAKPAHRSPVSTGTGVCIWQRANAALLT